MKPIRQILLASLCAHAIAADSPASMLKLPGTDAPATMEPGAAAVISSAECPSAP